MIFVNFKTYPEASGEKALSLARVCQQVEKTTGVSIFLCPQAVDIAKIQASLSLPVWAQHIDPVKPQRATGFTTAYAVARAGAQGTLLNHSEHPLEHSQLKEAIRLAKNEDLETLVFVKNIEEALKISGEGPEFIALEEPSLIASGQAMVDSVSGKEKVRQFLEGKLASFLLVGAGISSREDVTESVQRGAKGVVVSSAVILSKHPQKVLHELAMGFK